MEVSSLENSSLLSRMISLKVPWPLAFFSAKRQVLTKILGSNFVVICADCKHLKILEIFHIPQKNWLKNSDVDSRAGDLLVAARSVNLEYFSRT